jgi:lysozyme
MTPSKNCYKLIRGFEKLRLFAYRDSSGIWTIGYGSTFYERGAPVLPGERITPRRAATLFRHIIDAFARHVDKLVTAPVKQHQFDALVSFAYSVGLASSFDPLAPNFNNSPLLKMVNENPNDRRIREVFLGCRNGVVNGRQDSLPGLWRRRILEANLYFKDKKKLQLNPKKEVDTLPRVKPREY